MSASAKGQVLAAILFFPEPLASFDVYTKVGVAHLDESLDAYAFDELTPGCQFGLGGFPPSCLFRSEVDQSESSADVDAQRIGHVRITFTKSSSRHHRTQRWFWVADSAEEIKHVCDRKGSAAKVIDETGDEPITCIHPTCSVCGVPQVLESSA